jgi:hypothetical protein
MHSEKYRKLIIKTFLSTLIFIVSYISFNYNLLGVADKSWFDIHQLDSEQLVLDGILEAEIGNSKNNLSLGRYSRPSINDQWKIGRQLFKDRNTEGIFDNYISQFGLQGKFFQYLHRQGWNLSQLHSFNSTALALVAVFNFWILISLNFAEIPSFAFSISLAFSPWVVVFARNLYWVEFTWFLPMTVACLVYALKFKRQRNQEVTLLVLVFISSLLKLLCGYEYITTIYLSTVISIFILMRKDRISARKIIKFTLIITIAFFLSFGSALTIHAESLNRVGLNGWDTIFFTASKRVSSDNPEELFDRLCRNLNDYNDYDECVSDAKKYYESLEANPFIVTGKYFLIPSFFPWINNLIDFKFVRRALNASGLLMLAIAAVLTSHNKVKAFSVMTITALAPLSWFFLAKGHSFVHYHMNYVLWYIVTMPIIIYIIVNNLIKAVDLNSRMRSRSFDIDIN